MKNNALTSEIRHEIRHLRRKGVACIDVAARFGVSAVTVSRTAPGYQTPHKKSVGKLYKTRMAEFFRRCEERTKT